MRRERDVHGPGVVHAFWVSAVAFHVSLVLLTTVLVRRWARHRDLPPPAWLALLAADSAAWLAGAVVLAALCPLLGYASGFMVLRLLAQAVFGELPLLALLAAGLTLLGRRLLAATAPLAAAAALMTVYADAYHREPTDLQVRHHVVDSTHGSPAVGRLRILHLSDLQAHSIGPYELRVLEVARRQPADLVLWTGDYVQPRLEPTRATTTASLRALLRHAPIRAPFGSYAVQGDVDRDWPAVFEGTGIVPVCGRVIRLELSGDRHLSLVGLTRDMSRGHDPAVLELVRSAPPEDLRIVFGHNPDFSMLLADHAPVDLALAGHTHGGQVVLPMIGAPYTKSRLPRSLASGLGAYRGQALHVSAGIGMERGAAPQLRFGCPPEICVVDVVY